MFLQDIFAICRNSLFEERESSCTFSIKVVLGYTIIQ